MFNLGQLVNAVQRNCDISDARHAGDYTMCVFLLKMREYYRWEHDIPLSQNLPSQAVGLWLQERERLWEHLESTPFEPLPLERGSSDPFDSDNINRELVPRGFVYSGGYGRYRKPHFFLGELLRHERRNGCTVLVSSCEHARDLSAPPAMLQGDTIYVRQESVRRFLWEKIEESRWSQTNQAMARALACYEFDRDADSALARMTDNEIEAMILHELGEARAGALLGDAWHELLNAFARTRVEILARAVRDLLADCLSTLPGLVNAGRLPSLHFYFGNFSGMRRHLWPEAAEIYQRFAQTGDPGELRALAGDDVAARWHEAAQTMLDLYQRDGQHASRSIEARLLPDPG